MVDGKVSVAQVLHEICADGVLEAAPGFIAQNHIQIATHHMHGTKQFSSASIFYETCGNMILSRKATSAGSKLKACGRSRPCTGLAVGMPIGVQTLRSDFWQVFLQAGVSERLVGS